jgi:hypothetical protein
MTGQRETTRYATPSLRMSSYNPNRWYVKAMPHDVPVGFIEKHDAGWTATMPTVRYAGLWPTKQAAAEVLVKQAGYELGEL